MNSDEVRGSSGWYRPRHGIGEKVKKEERKKKSINVEEAIYASFFVHVEQESVIVLSINRLILVTIN